MSATSSALLSQWPATVRSRSIVGSLASFDLSGFTRLSERLAELGRDGAEEITNTVNDIFERLIERVIEVDGDVVSFGGDALLVLYTGDGHEQRAALTAAAVQHELHDHGVVRSSRGPVRLRVSVGVQSGVFTVAALGRHERHLVFVGADATATVELEGRARPGQALIGAPTAAAIPRSWWRAVGGDHVLGWRSHVPIGDRPDPHGSGPDLPPGEHRLAAVAFLKAGHLDQLFAAGRAAECIDALHAVAAVVEEGCHRFGVTWSSCDIAPDGAKFILVAGVPDAHEDDEERMLRCVRHIVDGASGHPIELGVGVNAGPIFAGTVGHPRRRTFTVMGDTVNVAARLMARARADEIVVNPRLIDRSAARFDVSPVETFAVKGKRTLQRAVTLGALRDRERITLVTPIFGREREVELVTASFERAAAGRGGAVEIVAEAGLGKSALVSAATAGFRDVTSIRAEGDPYRVTVPYDLAAPLVRAALGLGDAAALTTWCRTGAPELAPAAPLLAQACGWQLPDTPETARLAPEFRTARLHATVIDALDRRPDPTTLVLIAEDLHWGDDASVELLAAIAAAAAERNWLVVGSRRPEADGEGLSGPATRRIELGPLGPDDARRAAIAGAGTIALSDAQIDALVARAAGHPLFVRELVAGAGRGETDLPETVEQLIATRIDQLSPPDRLLLRYAAVAGRVVEPALIATCTGDAEVRSWSRWEPLVGFLERDGSKLVFRHDLLREVAYRGLATRRRRVLHARLGQAMLEFEPDPPPAQWPLLAVHFHEGHLPELAARFASQAATHSFAANAWAAAVPMYDIAIASLTDDEALRRLRRQRGLAQERIGLLAAAETDYRRANALGDAARVVQRQGRFRTALRLARAAQRGPDADRSADSWLREASILHQTGRYRLALAAATRAGELVTPDDGRARGATLVQIHHTSSALGLDSASIVEAALACLRESGDDISLGNLLLNLGAEDAYNGRWVETVARSREAVEAFVRAGDSMGVLFARNNLGEIGLMQGDFDGARAHLDATRRGFRAAGDEFMVACSEAALATIDCRRGDPGSAVARLRAVRDTHARLGAEEYVIDADLRLVEVEIWSGRGEHALSLLDDVEPRARRLGSATMNLAWAARLRSWAHVQRGELAAARAGLATCLDEARGGASPGEEALCLASLELIDRSEGRPTDPSATDRLATLTTILQVHRFPLPPMTARADRVDG